MIGRSISYRAEIILYGRGARPHLQSKPNTSFGDSSGSRVTSHSVAQLPLMAPGPPFENPSRRRAAAGGVLTCSFLSLTSCSRARAWACLMDSSAATAIRRWLVPVLWERSEFSWRRTHKHTHTQTRTCTDGQVERGCLLLGKHRSCVSGTTVGI